MVLGGEALTVATVLAENCDVFDIVAVKACRLLQVELCDRMFVDASFDGMQMSVGGIKHFTTVHYTTQVLPPPFPQKGVRLRETGTQGVWCGCHYVCSDPYTQRLLRTCGSRRRVPFQRTPAAGLFMLFDRDRLLARSVPPCSRPRGVVSFKNDAVALTRSG